MNAIDSDLIIDVSCADQCLQRFLRMRKNRTLAIESGRDTPPEQVRTFSVSIGWKMIRCSQLDFYNPSFAGSMFGITEVKTRIS